MAVHVQNQFGFVVEFHVAMVADEFEIVRMDFQMFLQANTTQKCTTAFVANMLNIVVTIFMVLQMAFRSECL